MKMIVVYNGKTGFTERYGKWIAKELGCKAVNYKDMTSSDYRECDTIIYGGAVIAGKVSGIDKIKEQMASENRRLIVFTVGATAMECTDIHHNIKDTSLTKAEQNRIPFFYFRGGINYEDMGFFSKKMLHILYRSLKKKENRTDDETGMMYAIEKSSDFTDISYIRPLVDYITDLSKAGGKCEVKA